MSREGRGGSRVHGGPGGPGSGGSTRSPDARALPKEGRGGSRVHGGRGGQATAAAPAPASLRSGAPASRAAGRGGQHPFPTPVSLGIALTSAKKTNKSLVISFGFV